MAHDIEYRAPMAAADQNDLPDSAFAYIEPGGTQGRQREDGAPVAAAFPRP